MRQSEFCIPTSNRAVISITNNWYDRRALDTRSNFALYHSLLHLQNLCQTSPKVRESLVCDGGLEQLIRILKEGKLRKVPDELQLSKWQQALLCLVNVGVRGSESVRNRLVEADVVPVILTILCNALDNILQYRGSGQSCKRSAHDRDLVLMSLDSRLLSALPVATIPDPNPLYTRPRLDSQVPTPAGLAIRADTTAVATRSTQPVEISLMATPATATQGTSRTTDGGNSARRRASAGSQVGSEARRAAPGTIRLVLRPPMNYIDSDANDSDETMSLLDGVQTDNEARIQDMTLETADTSDPLQLEIPPEAQAIHLSPSSTHDAELSTSPSRNRQPDLEIASSRPSDSASRMPTPWDQDVTLCLRLLAYLSKYPYLRPQFSRSHDVPRLRQNLKQYEMHCRAKVPATIYEQMSDDLSDSLQIPCNIFQVVENFTMRIHAPEPAYWAGVIMRNSCRRDEHSGGMRQCAYLECGAWETQNRQFAKCRRCRRTKYCSKACQSKAWTGHRFWCSSTHSDHRTAGRETA